MNKKLLTALLSIVTCASSAQYYCLPNYQAKQNPRDAYYNEESASGTYLLAASTTPQWSAVGHIPFAFYFNDTLVSDFKVSSTGVLTFDLGAPTPPSLVNAALPSPNIPNNS